MQTPPIPARDRTVPCLCAFQYRFRLRCIFSPMYRWPESRRCEGRDFFKCAHLIIPPTVKFAFLVMDSQGIAQPNFAELSKRRAFAFRSHDGPAPEIWIVNIDVFRGDIEIAADDKSTGDFFRTAITEPEVPRQCI